MKFTKKEGIILAAIFILAIAGGVVWVSLEGQKIMVIEAPKQEVSQQEQPVVNEPAQPNNQEQVSEDVQPTIDTSDWKTYRNEEYGFEIKYPYGWDIDSNNAKTYIYSSKIREDLPEGGGAFIVEVIEENISNFIEEYNASDNSRIVKEEKITFNNILATKMTGTTAIGVDRGYIFVSQSGKNYLIAYHEFDPLHKKMLSTVKFIN